MKKKIKTQPTHFLKTTETWFKVLGSVVILAVLFCPFLFYVNAGIAYMPSPQYLLASAVTAAVLIYSLLLIVTIPSKGRIVPIIVLFISTILISGVLLYLFTPLLNFIAAQFVDNIICSRIPTLTKHMSVATLKLIQSTCTDFTSKIIFNY